MPQDHRGTPLASNYRPLDEDEARSVAAQVSRGNPASALYQFAVKGHNYDFDQIISELGKEMTHPDADHSSRHNAHRLHNYLFAHFATNRTKALTEEDDEQ
jgi:hypothetical protein